MTDEAKALVERLRKNSGWRDESWQCVTDPTLLIEAADLIETQAREIERLNQAGDGDVGLIHWQGERIQHLEAALFASLGSMKGPNMTDRIRWKIASYIMPEWMLLTIAKALIKVLKDAEQ